MNKINKQTERKILSKLLVKCTCIELCDGSKLLCKYHLKENIDKVKSILSTIGDKRR